MSLTLSASRRPSSPLILSRLAIAMHLALGTIAMVAAGAPLSAQAQQKAQNSQNAQNTAEYNIAAGPMSEALPRFAQQAGVALSIEANRLTGLQTSGLHGQYSVEAGFNTLLRNSGYVIARTAAGYTLVRAPLNSAADVGDTTLPAVTVTAQAESGAASAPVQGYVARQSASAAKTDTALIKTPQAVSVVTREQMDVQNVQSVAQSLRYTSGINPEQRGTNTDSLEYLYARGFIIDQVWNGLRLPGAAGGSGYNVTSFDPYMLERVELLHGPASVLYGQGAPGGLVSLTSKQPTETPLHEIGFQTGNNGRAQGFFDFSGPVDQDGKLLYRLTADGVSTGTQTDHVRERRFAIAPTITWRPSADTNLTLYANYQTDPEAGIYNSVPAAGTVLPGKIAIPRSLDPGDPGFDSFKKKQDSVGYAFFHRFDEVWSIKQNYRYLHNDQTVRYVGLDGLSADGLSLAREPYLNTGTLDAHTIDNQVTAQYRTWALAHKTTVGLDYQNIQFNHYFFGSNAATPSLSIANPQYNQAIPYPSVMFGTSNMQTLKQLGLYAQDQVDIGQWSFILGGREDWTNESITSYVNGSTVNQSEKAFTWRAGGVYQFDSGLAPYLSYSKSFQPQVGSDFTGRAFVPQTGEQYEAGIKFQPKGYNSFVTVALFNLNQNNVTTGDPLHNGFSVQTGQVRSRGLEIEGHASLDNNLQLIASYTYTDLLNTKSNSANLNQVPMGIPSQSASLWADYTASSGLFNGLQTGAGVRYIGGSFGDTTNTFKTPSATLIDLSLRYDLGIAFTGMKGWTGNFNVSNLLDRNYIASCSGTSFCTWGLARTVTAGLKYQW